MGNIGSLVFYCIVIFIFVLFFKRYNRINNMIKRTQKLWSKITESIEIFSEYPCEDNLCSIIANIKEIGNVPNNPSYWDTLRAAYKLVSESSEISIERKKEFRQLLLAKGVNVR